MRLTLIENKFLGMALSFVKAGSRRNKIFHCYGINGNKIYGTSKGIMNCGGCNLNDIDRTYNHSMSDGFLAGPFQGYTGD